MRKTIITYSAALQFARCWVADWHNLLNELRSSICFRNNGWCFAIIFHAFHYKRGQCNRRKCSRNISSKGAFSRTITERSLGAPFLEYFACGVVTRNMVSLLPRGKCNQPDSQLNKKTCEEEAPHPESNDKVEPRLFIEFRDETSLFRKSREEGGREGLGVRLFRPEENDAACVFCRNKNDGTKRKKDSRSIAAGMSASTNQGLATALKNWNTHRRTRANAGNKIRSTI